MEDLRICPLRISRRRNGTAVFCGWRSGFWLLRASAVVHDEMIRRLEETLRLSGRYALEGTGTARVELKDDEKNLLLLRAMGIRRD